MGRGEKWSRVTLAPNASQEHPGSYVMKRDKRSGAVAVWLGVLSMHLRCSGDLTSQGRV